MAGIFIWHNSQQYNPDLINETFSSLDYSPGKYLQNSEWNVIVFPKSAYNIKNYLNYPDGIICGIGTYSYKGKVYEKALPLIYEDIKAKKLDLNNFWGSFLIFVSISDQNYLIRDGAMLARLHGLKNKPVYSNSFVGLLRVSKNKLNFDSEAATELLSTGVITGDATIVKEIQFITYDKEFEYLKCLHSFVNNLSPVNGRDKILNQQIEIAKSFVEKFSKDWFTYMPNSHFNVSITGGLDSRLLTALLLSVHSKFDFYTYWRSKNAQDPDFRLAKTIADHLRITLNYKKIKPSDKLDNNELFQLFTSGHNSCDGVIRPGTFWDEEFSTANYRLQLSNLPYL